MKLRLLCEEIEYERIKGSMDTEVEGIVYDSRKIRPGTLFVCMVGAVTDGHRFIPDAVAGGAAAIVLEREEEAARIPEGITVLRVSSSRRALALLSAAFFDHPDRKLVTIGVTGTSGKTTTTHMIQTVLERAGKKAGLIGTIETKIGEERFPTKNTTPESYELHRLFAAMAEAGCEYAVMEVSSQALKLDRTAGICFDYGIFTNFSPDHIGANEHDSLEDYLACKSRLFRQCRVGIVNADDPKSEEVLAGADCEVYSFAAETDGVCRTVFCGKPVDLTATQIDLSRENGKLGVRFSADGVLHGEVTVPIPGQFSVYNALATILTCHLVGMPWEAITAGLEQARVPGRVEMVPVSDEFYVIIDYAHNEKSTRGLLTALLAYQPNRLICVYGGGGNRSRLRRYDMGEVTGELADLSILTCDNPRGEDIRDINADIKVGLARSGGTYLEIDDRKEAIAYCLRHAAPGDMIVLIGKGHEAYQEIRGVKVPYDERATVREVMEELEAETGKTGESESEIP